MLSSGTALYTAQHIQQGRHAFQSLVSVRLVLESLQHRRHLLIATQPLRLLLSHLLQPRQTIDPLMEVLLVGQAGVQPAYARYRSGKLGKIVHHLRKVLQPFAALAGELLHLAEALHHFRLATKGLKLDRQLFQLRIVLGWEGSRPAGGLVRGNEWKPLFRTGSRCCLARGVGTYIRPQLERLASEPTRPGTGRRWLGQPVAGTCRRRASCSRSGPPFSELGRVQNLGHGGWLRYSSLDRTLLSSSSAGWMSRSRGAGGRPSLLDLRCPRLVDQLPGGSPKGGQLLQSSQIIGQLVEAHQNLGQVL